MRTLTILAYTVAIGICIAICVALLTDFSTVLSPLTGNNERPDKEESAKALDELKGKLYFARAPEPSLVTDIHYLDLATGEVSGILKDNEVKFSPQVSHNRRYVAYSAAPIDHTSTLRFPHTEHLQIHIYDTVEKTVDQISTTTETFRKKKSRWSPDDRYLLFHGYQASAYEKKLSPDEPDNWLIYLYDTTNRTFEVMTTGLENEWTPDGKYFYFFHNDGLYIKDIATKEEKKLIEVVNPDGEAKTNIGMTLALSADGKYLAWASARSGVVMIYYVGNNYLERPVVIHRLELPEGTSVVHPVFSPDSRFLAVQETELQGTGFKERADPNELLDLPAYDLSNPRFTVYELINFNARKVLDISNSDFNGTSLTQWVY